MRTVSMAYALTDELDRLVREKLATGAYANEEAVLRAALRSLDQQEATLAAIAEGYKDLQAGRHRTFEAADAEFRQQHNIAADA